MLNKKRRRAHVEQIVRSVDELQVLSRQIYVDVTLGRASLLIFVCDIGHIHFRLDILHTLEMSVQVRRYWSFEPSLTELSLWCAQDWLLSASRFKREAYCGAKLISQVTLDSLI